MRVEDKKKVKYHMESKIWRGMQEKLKEAEIVDIVWKALLKDVKECEGVN